MTEVKFLIYSQLQLVGICHIMFRMDCNFIFNEFLNWKKRHSVYIVPCCHSEAAMTFWVWNGFVSKDMQMDSFIPYTSKILDLCQDGAKVSDVINLYLDLKMPNRIHSQNPDSLRPIRCLPLALIRPKLKPLQYQLSVLWLHIKG